MPITFPCEQCGQRYQVDATLAGKRMKCKKCEAVMRVPGAAAPSAAAARPAPPPPPPPPRPRVAAPATFDLEETDDPYGLDELAPAAPVKATAEFDDVGPLPRAARPGQPKRKEARSTTGADDGFGAVVKYLAMGGIGLSAAGLGAALVGFVLPASNLLAAGLFVLGMVAAGLVLLVGAIWMLFVVFSESVVCGLLYLFVPFYGLIYLVTRWDRMRRPFLSYLGGCGLLFVPLLLLAVLGPSMAKNRPAGAPMARNAPPLPNVTPPQPGGMNFTPPAIPPMPPGAGGGFNPPPAPPVAGGFNPPAPPAPTGFNAPPTDAPVPATVMNHAETMRNIGGFAPPSAAGRPADLGLIAPGAAPLIWKVQPDPPAEPVTFPPGKEIKIGVPDAFGSDRIDLPSTRSAFVMVGGNDADNQAREVWDLRGPNRVGRLAGRLGLTKPITLSPDGRHVAARCLDPRSVRVYSTADGRQVQQLETNELHDLVDFAGPDRVVVGFSSSKVFRVYEITTGRKVAEVVSPQIVLRETIAFSPGRRYMAYATRYDDHVRVHDLNDGTLVGEIAVFGGTRQVPECDGLAFSDDGKALAGLYQETFKGSHLLCWDAATGRQESHHLAPEKDGIKPKLGFDGFGLQWLPDGSGWLAYGETLVERSSGQKVWNLPFDDQQGLIKGPRRVLDEDRALITFGDHNRQFVRTAPLLKDKIRQAMTIARSGGDAADATLPPLTKPDLGSARLVAAAAGVAWSAAPDAAPAPRKTVGRPIGLGIKAQQVGRAVVAPAAGVGYVSAVPGGRQPGREASSVGQEPHPVERLDLATGKVLGRFDLPAVAELRAAGPDGARLLTGQTDGDRLDVFNADGQHVAGWRPHADAEGDARKVAWADFVDADRVLTLSGGGTLALWELPSCRAVYLVKDAGGPAARLSPGRKLVAVRHDRAFRLFNAATGEPRGETARAAPGGEECRAAAFRDDGAELAAVVGNGLVRWDVRTGQVVDEFPIAGASTFALEYAGPGHVLAATGPRLGFADDWRLVDLARRRTVWTYHGGEHAVGNLGSVHWIAPNFGFTPTALRPLALPEPKVVALVDAAYDPATRALLRDGAELGLQVDGNPPRDPEGYRRGLAEKMAGQLGAVGARLVDGAPARLVVKLEEKDTGATMELRKLGGGLGQDTRRINVKEIVYEVAVADGQGPPIVIDQGRIGMQGFGITRLPPGENDWEGFLRHNLWLHARDAVTGGGLPFFVARRGGEAIVLPGRTDLNAPVPAR